MNAPAKEPPDKFELRGRPAPVTRLSRRALAVVVGGLMLFALLTLLWAFRPRERAAPPQETPNIERVTPAEGLRALPSDYRQVPMPALPKLATDLPQAQEQKKDEAQDQALRAEQQRLRSDAEAAAKAQVFFQTERNADAPPATDSPDIDVAAPAPAVLQDQPAAHAAAVPAKPDNRTFADPEMHTPRSPYLLMAGTVIPAALLTAIHSDLSGPVIATVTEPVYDTLSGRFLLVPQGSRLIGEYDSKVAYGQQRVLLVWTRLIRPDGSSIALDRLPAADASGQAGLDDQVDRHWRRLWAGAALSTLFGVGTQLIAPDNYVDAEGRLVIALRESVQESASQIGQQLTQRSLDVPPTLTIRAGMPVRAIVNRDLTLPPRATRL